MKQLFSEDHGVGVFAAGNLALSGVESVLAKLEPILHLLVSAGQVAVAVVTVLYIWRKVRTLKVPAKKKSKK